MRIRLIGRDPGKGTLVMQGGLLHDEAEIGASTM
jgi:hypothetical protein